MSNKLSKIDFNDYKPLREVIFNSIREAIILGELKPGERLMEVQLAEKTKPFIMREARSL
jgi:DNA-binding GntR family transcriptional regulator